MIQSRTISEDGFTIFYLHYNGVEYCQARLKPFDESVVETHLIFFKFSHNILKEFLCDIEEVKEQYKNKYKRFLGINNSNNAKWKKFLAVCGFPLYELNKEADFSMVEIE